MKLEKQFTVYRDNLAKSLPELIKSLADNKVNIVAFAIDNAAGTLRFVADKPDKVLQSFMEVTEEEVLAMELPHRPGSLAVIVSRLSEKGVIVNYAYASGIGAMTLAILHVSDIAKAQEILSS